MNNQFTIFRISKLMTQFRQSHGRDMSLEELKSHGFDDALVSGLVRSEVISKYQVAGKGGRLENRFKLKKNWKQLNS
jgi:uncharacterized protein with von Willebrand factor type A (vWA) domain